MIQRKKIAFLGFPFFFILPWLGFIFSLFDIKAKSSGVVYIATAAIFCFAFSFTDQSADSYRYALSFQEFDTNLTYEKLVILYQNGELRDLYRFLLYYLASLFSQNPKVMFAFAGMFYGYFSYQNMKILNMEFKGKLDKFTIIISLCFFVYCSFSNVNGLRFTTGAMVMFFSTYNLIIRNKLIYIIGVFALPLFHYGFVLLVPIIIGYLMINKFMYSNKGINKLLLTAFIIAFVLSWVLGTNSINLGFLANSGFMSGEIGNRIEFLNSDQIANMVELRTNNSLFLSVEKYFNYAIKLFVFGTILFLNKNLKYLPYNKESYTKLLAFVIFFYAFAYVALSFPSGERFMYIAHLFLFVYIAKLYSNYKSRTLKNIILLAIPVYSFNIAFIVFFLPIMILSPTFWYGNFFWILGEGIGFKL